MIMNIKRIMAYGVYYGVFWNLFIVMSIKLLDYFEGYNWKSVAIINVLTFVLIIPIMNRIGKKIDKNLPML